MTDAAPVGRPPDGTLGFIHVDMDAFFASCELLRRPELRGEPVVVGGVGDRGVVAAASYAARAYGIHSAMPSARARRLCPHAVFLPGDHRYYGEVSSRVMAIFGDITHLVEPLSLDEAFLDVRGALHGEDRAAAIAAAIRRRVFEAEGLTCSVGVATNKFLAKLATERAKPRPSLEGPRFGSGVYVIEPGHELDFLHPMPVRDLWGVGPATESKLSRMGIETVGDLASQSQDRLEAGLGRASGLHLHQLAHAVDVRPVVVDQRAKSIGHEETFPRDLTDGPALRRQLVRRADAVATRLRAAGFAGRTVTIKVRFADFATITRAQTLPEPVDGATPILRIAELLLDRVDTTSGVRLLGLSVSQLVEPVAEQLTLDDAAGPGWNEADDVIEEIRNRFGGDAIGPATLAKPGGSLDRMERGQQQWGPNDP
ncbi:MAG: DNA polymerase IV [Acidimicrobiales bacterium]|nr:DNA polymerase IV [Acidimicrobiales bacterium]